MAQIFTWRINAYIVFSSTSIPKADDLEKELLKEDPDPCASDLKWLQRKLNASHAAALAEWKDSRNPQPTSSWFGNMGKSMV